MDLSSVALPVPSNQYQSKIQELACTIATYANELNKVGMFAAAIHRLGGYEAAKKEWSNILAQAPRYPARVFMWRSRSNPVRKTNRI